MFKILAVDLDVSTKNQLERVFANLNPNIAIQYKETNCEAVNYITNHDIDFFIIELEENPLHSFQFTEKLCAENRFFLTPIVFIAPKIDFIITAYQKYHCLDYIVKPLSSNSFDRVLKIIDRLYYQHIFVRNNPKRYILLSSSQADFRVSLDSIIFIESSGHKCIVHTYHELIHVSIPMKKILESIKGTTLVQSHKSFVINTALIFKIIKSSDAWTAYFHSYDKSAPISRTFKKEVEKRVMSEIVSQTE